MTEFAWGVLTPFIAIAGLALALGAAYLLGALARHIWGKTNFTLMSRVDLAKNLKEFPLPGRPEKPKRPEYYDAATTFRDALVKSPRMWTAAGLGWRILLVRETRSDD